MKNNGNINAFMTEPFVNLNCNKYFMIFSSVSSWRLSDLPLEDFLQKIGVGVTTSVAVLYFLHWYYLTFTVQQEHEYLDFAYRSHRDRYRLTPEQEFACSFYQQKVDLVKKSVLQGDSQLLSLWGADSIAIESIVQKALVEIQARALFLDFRKAIWIEDLDAWIDRLEATSNPFHMLIRQLGNLLVSLGFGNSNALTTSDTEDVYQEKETKKLTRFRLLLSEKSQIMEKIANRQPDRPLVIFLKGLDRLLAIERGRDIIMGNKYLHEYLEYFVGMTENIRSLIVITSLSEGFWMSYWIRNPRARQQGWSIHIPSKTPDDVISKAKSISTSQLIKDEDTLKKIVQFWGTNTKELFRVLRFYSTNHNISVDRLLSSEVQEFILDWCMNQQKAHLLGLGNTEDTGSSIDSSELDELTLESFLAVPSKLQMDSETKILKKIASTQNGELPFQLIMLYKQGRYVPTVLSMIKRNILTLNVTIDDRSYSSLNTTSLSNQAMEMLENLQKSIDHRVEEDTDRNVEEGGLKRCPEKWKGKIEFKVAFKRQIERFATLYLCDLITESA